MELYQSAAIHICCIQSNPVFQAKMYSKGKMSNIFCQSWFPFLCANGSLEHKRFIKPCLISNRFFPYHAKKKSERLLAFFYCAKEARENCQFIFFSLMLSTIFSFRDPDYLLLLNGNSNPNKWIFLWKFQAPRFFVANLFWTNRLNLNYNFQFICK